MGTTEILNSIDKNDILRAWIKYINIEELEHVKIDIGKKDSYSEIYYENVEYITEESKPYLKINLNDSVKKYLKLVETDTKNINSNDEINLFFLFPPITIRDQKKEYRNFVFALNISTLLTKEHKQFINIPLNDSGIFIPLLASISEYLEIDPSEIDDYFPINITPVDAVKKITHSQIEDFKKLIEQLINKIKKNIESNELREIFKSKKIQVTVDDPQTESSVIGFITNIQVQSFNFNLKKDLKSLLTLDIDKNSIAYKYLFNTHNYENSGHKLTFDYWLGFNNRSGQEDKIFALAKGQAIVMQYLQNSKDIIAVQGPPGTGKTTLFLSVIANTIVNRVLSIINGHDFNNWMIIVSTSNKAVDNVSERFEKDFEGENWFYFIAGNKGRIEKNIKRIVDFIEELKTSNFNSNIEKYYNDLMNEIKKISSNLIASKHEYDNNNFGEYFRTNDNLLKYNQELYEKSLEFLCYHILKNKDSVLRALEIWHKLLSDGKSEENNFKEIESSKFGIKELIQWISLAYPVVTSTLSSVNNIFKISIEHLKDNKPFYLSLSDESGMAPLHTIFPLLYKSEKTIVVGDPKQLDPIVPVSGNQEDYYKKNYFMNDSFLFNKYSPTKVSAYHRAAFCKTGSFNDIGNGIILNEHRRCAKVIADTFKNIAEYEGIDIKTGDLSKTEDFYPIFKSLGGKHLILYDIYGKEGKIPNTNIEEINLIGEILIKLKYSGLVLNKFGNIGIITPYSNQEKLLIARFGKELHHTNDKACIGTVHKFQGTEFEIIIFSPVIFSKNHSSNFINSKPNLLNVAISRAKKLFIVVGSYNKLKESGGYLGKLIYEIENNGVIKKIKIIALDNEKFKTFNIKEHLKSNGFKWCKDNKYWYWSINDDKNCGGFEKYKEIKYLMDNNGYGYKVEF